MKNAARRLGLAVAVLGLMAAAAGQARAGLVIVSASGSGWYQSDGLHVGTNLNYFTGTSDSYRNFFVFDLSGVTAPVVSAELQAYNPYNGFNGSAAIYTTFDVTTAIPDLVAGHTGRTDIFADLGSGLNYGSKSVSIADNDTLVNIGLNGNAVTAINASLGGSFAIGGSLGSSNGFLFGFTGSSNVRQLVLTTEDAPLATPEPSTIALACSAVPMGLGLAWRRRRKAVTA